MTAIRGSVNVDDFRRLAGKSSTLPPVLKRKLRAAIRAAALVASDDSRTTIDDGEPSKTGLRMAIAAGIHVVIMTGNIAGAKIVGDLKQMPDGKRPMVRAMNKVSFRHPVYGDASVWVVQDGRPYFGTVIDKHREEITAAVERAMADALATLK